MDTSIARRRSQFRRDISFALVLALAVQGAFTAALSLPETVLSVPSRFILGLVSVPLSATVGTLFVRRRHAERAGASLVVLFFSLVVIIVGAGFLFSAMTGDYDLP
jgi:FtsH-binding integral membrane protein